MRRSTYAAELMAASAAPDTLFFFAERFRPMGFEVRPYLWLDALAVCRHVHSTCVRLPEEKFLVVDLLFSRQALVSAPGIGLLRTNYMLADVLTKRRGSECWNHMQIGETFLLHPLSSVPAVLPLWRGVSPYRSPVILYAFFV